MQGILMLEDGKSFIGTTEYQGEERFGEVIANTAVVGYQEMMTDPANAGKILVLTYPLIGNYGCAEKFNESENVWVAGLIIKENSRVYSNWQAKESFNSFNKNHGLLSLHGVDTRTLAVHLRQKGSMLGVISTKNFDKRILLEKIKTYRKEKGEKIIAKVSTKIRKSAGKKSGRRIAVLDLGLCKSMIRQLESLSLSLTVLPYNTKGEEIIALKPGGLIISSGPEDVSELSEVSENIKPLIGRIPILGISAGNLVLAGALGAKITKLKTGHRGVNYPVQNPLIFKGEITAQNHSFVIDPASLLKNKKVKVTGYNLNDRTIEEIESKKLKIIGTQYLPVSPGFNEINPVFKRFLTMIKRS